MTTLTGTATPRKAAPLTWLHPAVVTGGLLPAAYLVWLAVSRRLGANPVSEALNQLGYVALMLLIASLACTPLRTMTGWTWLFRMRRTLGLLAFAYAALHVTVYVGLDQTAHWSAIFEDITQRPFIIAGVAAFLCLLALALTSTAASVKRLGSKNWKRLHKLAYVAGILGVIHFYLRVKSDTTEPLLFAAILAVFLLARIAKYLQTRPASRI
jgi:sulfoxide reductase heme-binding subunit YedZ